MQDPYLSRTETVKRLVAEYEKHKGLTIAIDFDNTIYDYHQRGDTYYNVIKLIQNLAKVKGIRIVIWSCSEKSRYPFIEKYLNDHKIPFHGINENPDWWKMDADKIFYSLLLDDRAGLHSAYVTALDFLAQIEYNIKK